jgi:hypothetical protein
LILQRAGKYRCSAQYRSARGITSTGENDFLYHLYGEFENRLNIPLTGTAAIVHPKNGYFRKKGSLETLPAISLFLFYRTPHSDTAGADAPPCLGEALRREILINIQIFMVPE